MFTVKNAVDGIFDVAKALNPMTTKWDETQEAVCNKLLDEGLTPEQIIDFVGVDIDDLEEHLQIEVTIRQRMAKKKATTAK